MKKAERNALLKWAENLTDEELKDNYYKAVYDSLGSETEIMYELGYDIRDIEEREKHEKYLGEKADILEMLCEERGIKLWGTKEDTNIENGYYYIENGVIKKEDGYTDSFQEVGRVSNLDFEKEIRNKTIDEFAEKISLGISESIIWGMFSYNEPDKTSEEIVDYVIDTVKEIAEQLKKEVQNDFNNNN